MVNNVEEKPELPGFKKHVGIEPFLPIAVNPDTAEEIAVLLGFQDASKVKTPEYVKTTTVKVKSLDSGVVVETDKEVAQVTIDVYLKGSITGNIKRQTIWLKDIEMVSYKNPQAPKWKYINSVGMTSWATSEDALPDYFTHFTDWEGNKLKAKTVRKCKDGEEELFKLINAWVGNQMKHLYFAYDISSDELLKGKVKSLRNGLTSEYADEFLGLYYIETSEDGQKQYEKIFSKAYLPKNFMGYINNGFVFPPGKNGKPHTDAKTWEYFKKAVESPNEPQYGLKGFYVYEPVREYKEEDKRKDIAAATQTIVRPTAASAAAPTSQPATPATKPRW